MRWVAALVGCWRWLWSPRSLGARGESLAIRFLKRKGYVIVGRGQRSRFGEMDIVAVDGRTIVFVEVKTRTSLDAGHPADAVDEAKQRRLTKLALVFLREHRLLECRARFDVIAIIWGRANEPPALEHIENAF